MPIWFGNSISITASGNTDGYSWLGSASGKDAAPVVAALVLADGSEVGWAVEVELGVERDEAVEGIAGAHQDQPRCGSSRPPVPVVERVDGNKFEMGRPGRRTSPV